jgi:hypothetical protein
MFLEIVNLALRHSITTLSIMTRSMTTLLQYADFHYSECCILFIAMLNTIMLSVDAECHYTECRYAEWHYAECLYAGWHYAECLFAECHYGECCILFIVMLNVIMLSVFMLDVIMLSVFMLNIVTLSVVFYLLLC